MQHCPTDFKLLTLSSSRTVSCSPSAFCALSYSWWQFLAAHLPSGHCYTACHSAGMLSAILGVTGILQLSKRASQMARKKWYQNGNMFAWKVFPRKLVRQNESNSLLSAPACWTRLISEKKIKSDFCFQGPVISEYAMSRRPWPLILIFLTLLHTLLFDFPAWCSSISLQRSHPLLFRE